MPNYQEQNSPVNYNQFVQAPKQGYDSMKTRIFGGLSMAMNDLNENQKGIPSNLSDGFDNSFIERGKELRDAAINNQNILRRQIQEQQRQNLEAVRRHEEQMRAQQYNQPQVLQQPMNQYSNNIYYPQQAPAPTMIGIDNFMSENNQQMYQPVQQMSQPMQQQTYQQVYQPTSNVMPQPTYNEILNKKTFVDSMNILIDEIANIKTMLSDLITSLIKPNSDEIVEPYLELIEQEPELKKELENQVSEGTYNSEEVTIDPVVADKENIDESLITSGIDESGKPVHRRQVRLKSPKLKIK